MTDPSARFEVTPAPRGTRFREIRTFAVLDSTNRYLADAARDGEYEGLVAIAQHQSEGRGRQGRKWDSKPGAALLLSVLLKPQEVNEAQRLSHAMGLAIIDACRLVGDFTAQLKWPNDVVVEGRKLAGILAELVETDDEHPTVVVGAGINLNWQGELPEALRTVAVSADDIAGHSIDVHAFTEALLRGLHERLARPTWLLQAYRERCATVGQAVRVTTADGEWKGTALDVDDVGALIVETEKGERRTVTAGDVTHVRTDPH